MASLVLGVVGGMIGGPFGYAVGSYLGGMLFNNTPDQHSEGPRIQELKIQSSAYGTPIPIVYGRSRVAGNVIWANDIAERVHTTSSSSGKGSGGDVTSTSYTYDVDVAISMCEGPITGVARIWADSKLVYDITGTAPMTEDIGSLTIHIGTETQEVDSLIQAYEALVPAYRGVAYIVFENFQLGNFGNRIPNFTFEVVTEGEVGVVAPTTLVSEYMKDNDPLYQIDFHHYQANINPPYDYLSSGYSPEPAGSIWWIDPTRGLAISHHSSDDYTMPWLTKLYWQIFDTPTMTSPTGSAMVTLVGPNTSMVMYNNKIISMFDTLYGGVTSPTYWFHAAGGHPSSYKSLVDGAYTYIPAYIVDVLHNTGTPGYNIIKIPTAYGISNPTTLINLYNIRDDEDAYIPAVSALYDTNYAFIWDTDVTYSSPVHHDFDPSFWGGGGGPVQSRSHGIIGIWHAPDGKSYLFGRYEVKSGNDPANTNIVIMSTNGPADYVQTDRVGYGVNHLAMAKLIDVLDDRDQIYLTDWVNVGGDEFKGGHLFDIIYDGEAAARFCFRMATAIRDPNNSDAYGAALLGTGNLIQNSPNTAIWWSKYRWTTDTVFNRGYVHEIPLLGETISTDPVNLKDIVDNIEERVDVTTSLRDNTDLSPYTVDGYTLTKTMTGRAAIEPLALAYQFDVIESEGLLESVKRGDF